MRCTLLWFYLCFLILLKCLLNYRISKNNKEEVLEKAEKDLATVRDQQISRLVKELQGTDFWKLRRAYSPGVASFSPYTLVPKCNN